MSETLCPFQCFLALAHVSLSRWQADRVGVNWDWGRSVCYLAPHPAVLGSGSIHTTMTTLQGVGGLSHTDPPGPKEDLVA